MKIKSDVPSESMIEDRLTTSEVNDRPPIKNAMRTAKQSVNAPTRSPTLKRFNQPLLNEVPNAVNGSVSRYLLHSQPTKRAASSIAESDITNRAGPTAAGKIIMATANIRLAAMINSAKKMKNLMPLRGRPSGSKQ